MYEQIQTLIGRAKAGLVLENPFIASIVCGMPVVVDDTIQPPTLQTNGVSIMVHPKWADAHTKDELKWALAHEVMHNVFQHCLIAHHGGRNPAKLNIAQDVIINVLLETDNIGKRPANVIWDATPMLGGKTAKTLYDEGKTSYGVYELLPDPPEGSGGAGQGPWDMTQPFQGDASQQAEMQAKWQVKVAQAAAAAKMCGKLSQTMERLVTGALKPKVAWADQLRHFFTKRARVESSFARPNRRFMSQNLYLPGRDGTTLGPVLIAVDLSGSVTPRELEEFLTELRAIKEDCRPSQVHVLYFASQVMGHEVFEQDDELDLHPNGTGGTAFSPIFRYADEHGIEPDACVVLTDLCCNDFGPVPEYPVMWASTSQDKAPWGEVIMLRQAHG